MKLHEEIGRIGLKLVFHSKFKFKFTYNNFDKNRKEPYFLVCNHASLNDPLYVGMNLKYYPYPVASNLLYTKFWMRFALTKIVTSIPKRKAQSDVQTIRSILKAFKEDKRGIMIFPEGNSSYFGESTPTDYTSTAKIVKKINEDLVLAKINGGFFAAPRWGKTRKKGAFNIDYSVLINKENLKDLSVEEISEILEENIIFNDYEWNKINKVKYKSNIKAKGLENYLYVCPKCHGHQTIWTSKNDIGCEKCGKLAHINEYHFLEGLPFDNLISWDHIQQNELPNILKSKVYSKGKFYLVDFKRNKQHHLGFAETIIDKEKFILKTKNKTYEFLIENIYGVALTQKRNLSFDYDNETYLIDLYDAKLYLDILNYLKKGDSL